jgi:hypothetical protein
MKYYAGIGSRKTPFRIMVIMKNISRILEKKWILRSGGAPGADTAFECGIMDANNMQIFLPDKTFNGRSSNDIGYINFMDIQSEYRKKAIETVEMFHPNPDSLNGFGIKLMARNALQVLGPDLNTPSSLIICWTPNGEISGGTGQALRIAKAYDIPVVNLGDNDTYLKIKETLESGANPQTVTQDSPQT